MKIKTKFDVGDDCWVMFADKPKNMLVSSVTVEVDENEIKTEYTLGDTNSELKYTDDMLFDTKEDLIKSL